MSITKIKFQSLIEKIPMDREGATFYFVDTDVELPTTKVDDGGKITEKINDGDIAISKETGKILCYTKGVWQ